MLTHFLHKKNQVHPRALHGVDKLLSAQFRLS